MRHAVCVVVSLVGLRRYLLGVSELVLFMLWEFAF